MSAQASSTTRRKFAFWVGFGLFSLSERLHAQVLDELAAATMWQADPKAEPALTDATSPEASDESDTVVASQRVEHWSASQNQLWKWFERENLIDGRWKLTGITTPIHRETGEPYTGETGYLSEDLVPSDVRYADRDSALTTEYDADGPDEGQPLAERRNRHGRPPSKWLRSLHAVELHIWLKKIRVPEAGVSGMTFMTHLTRDHSFEAEKIEGLADEDLAKLHAAAHYGY